jgi:hypothetical protein
MPSRTSRQSGHSLSYQLTALFIATILVAPDLVAQQPSTAPVATGTHTAAAASQIPPTVTANQGPLTCENPAQKRRILLSPTQDKSNQRDLDEWGSITVAQPKIWQFERVSALLDGLLRDIEGVSLNDLTQLDPNAQNAAAVKFVQSALEVGVQYDQAAAVTNGINRNNYQLQSQAAQKRFEADNTYIDLLVEQRNAQTAQLLAAQNTVNSLQPLEDANAISKAQAEQLAIAKARVTALTSSMANINDAIGKASLTSLAAAPSLTNTSVQPPASGVPTNTALSSYSDLLNSLPQGAKDNLSAALKAPSLPATKRLDNFLTLLYERLAREVSVLQDDLTRSPENVAYLLQFDVGVYPSRKAKNHNARVEFEINCPNCKVYSLYPGQSSYNLANYSAASRRTTLWGNVLTLMGFGASASYRRQVDTLQGGLVQSVYTVGFQNGVLPNGEKDGEMPDGSAAVQRFGWYYGAAPFEEVVTPGIRSTFAVITVPREDIDRARDIFGNSTACVPFQIVSEWAKRDDPMRQRESESPAGRVGREGLWPLYNWTNTDLPSRRRAPAFTEHSVISVAESSTSVKLPGAPESSFVANREQDTLHVLRMEYNTVFSDPPIAEQGPPALPSASPASDTKTPSATSNSGSSTAPLPPPTPVTTADTYNPLSPCAPKQCTGMLLRLDRPVDPNLVVTVRGEPLKRVRDWRGRATSVLPPAQSGTDLTSQAVANGSLGNLLTKHLDGARSLLETDQPQPNSWFALNSKEIFMTISRDLATDDEFPVIQISSPEHSVIIPHDLQRGITDLIINGSHMRSPGKAMLFKEILRTYASDEFVRDLKLDASDDAPIDAGPYPYTTFVPLFLADRGASGSNPAVKIYARLGESKDDLLIGFQPREHGGGCPGNLHKGCWSEGHTQVVLEDHDLDFAWSLSCFEQGEELACHLPRSAIQQVYAAYLGACPASDQEDACPGAKDDQKAIRLSAVNAHYLESLWIPGIIVKPTLRANPFLKTLKNAYVSSLQVWVIQSDTDNDNVFYTATPAHLDFFPVSDNYWEGSPFKAWQFSRATKDNIDVRGCNYFPGDREKGKTVTLLGSLFPPEAKPLEPDQQEGYGSCHIFKVPTIALRRSQLVFTIAGGPGYLSLYPTPMSIPTFKLAPGFSKAEVTPFYLPVDPKAASPHFNPDHWIVDIPVSRAICGDQLEPSSSVVEFEWFIGSRGLGKGKPCSALSQDARDWEDIDPANGIHLELTISSDSLMGLPKTMTLVRHSQNGEIVT